MLSIHGSLFIYDEDKKLVAFESGKNDSDTCLIFIGGMTDGLLALPFIPQLSEALASELGISLVQVMMSSSYRSYGIASLKEDATNIGNLLTFLTIHGKKNFILFGHSTGCQDILWYLKHHHTQGEINIISIIMHGGVSDRDYITHSSPNWESILKWAENKCRTGAESELYHQLINGVPFNAYRLHSLLAYEGDDDYFSKDLPVDYLRNKFEIISMPTLILFSGDDEYVPNKDVYDKLFTAYQDACTSLIKFGIIENANHAVSGPDAQLTLIRTVISFLKSIM